MERHMGVSDAKPARSAPAASTADDLLAVDGAHKSYGTREALRGVSFRVARGEFVALLGPNGAGKSTLFQLLTGLFNADRGQIAVCGHDIRHHAVRALAHVGVVFQQSTLDLDLSVEANLRFHARLHGLGGRRARERIDEGLRRLGLAERARDPVRSLSGGNRRKVELVRAMLHEPAVLLMDEATVGLDPASRRQLLEEVLALRERGVGILWATHLVDEAEAADRVIVLHRGRILAEGRPDQLARGAGETLAEAFLRMTGGGEGEAVAGG